MAYRFRAGETVPEGVRRIAREQLDRSLKRLESDRRDRGDDVHSARKSMKRLRALVRLVRDDLGATVYERENACFREAARRLAGLRDATVLVQSLDELVAWLGRRAPRSRFAPVRLWLDDSRQQEYGRAGSLGQATESVVEELRGVSARLADWPLRAAGWAGLGPGVRRVYARGRREHEGVCWTPSVEALHQWRKRVKYLWYHTQLLQPMWPGPLETLAVELDLLGELLGRDHDLAVLGQTARQQAGAIPGASGATLSSLQRRILEYRSELQTQCQVLGQRIYAEPAGAFARRLGTYWQAWGEEQIQRRKPRDSPVGRKRMQMEPELIADYQCKTGEGPLWHPDEKCLYWLDIPNGRMFRYDPSTGKHEQVFEGEEVGGLTIQEDGALLLFMARGAVALWRQGEDLDYLVRDLEQERESRFNDVIADPAGRVFCGTMPSPDHLGRLYRLDVDAGMTTVLEDVGVSNGMGFTPDRRRMYFTDSPTRQISVFDYDESSGELANRRIFADLGGGEGIPDGMTVDAEGYVWSAQWDGGCLVRFSPDGKEDRRLEFPARKVSCATFGGDDYGDLYVTTAGGDEKATDGEGAGALFRIRPGVIGVPEFRSRILL